MTKSPITRFLLNDFIDEAYEANDWTKVENANVSNITDMSYLFDCVLNIKNLDLSSWDTSNVKDMSYMFSESDFNSPLHFNTSNVKNMSGMFSSSEFNSPLHFDTSNVEDTEDIFANLPFNQDISDWVVQDTEYNQDVIKYRDECILKRKEREAIEASIGNNNKNSGCGFKL